MKKALMFFLVYFASGFLFAATSGSGIQNIQSVSGLSWYPQILHTLLQNIRTLFLAADGLVPVISLISSAFLYGVIHTLGPGHHKFLLGAWIFSEKRQWKQAFHSSFILSAGHAISVMVLFLVILIAGEGAALMGVTDSRTLISRISAVLLLIFSFSILIKRIRAAMHRHSKKNTPESAPESTACSCSHCSSGSRESPLIFGIAALVPCPGATLFMLWGYAAGRPLLSLTSIFVVSAGMSLTLIIIASVSMLSRDFGDRLIEKKTGAALYARSIFETGAGISMVCVSTLMLLSLI